MTTNIDAGKPLIYTRALALKYDVNSRGEASALNFIQSKSSRTKCGKLGLLPNIVTVFFTDVTEYNKNEQSALYVQRECWQLITFHKRLVHPKCFILLNQLSQDIFDNKKETIIFIKLTRITFIESCIKVDK